MRIDVSPGQSAPTPQGASPAPILDPWRVSPDDFPEDATPDEQLWFLLHYAICAPSTHNTQPWLFRLREHQVELRADWARSLPIVDPDGRELVMSCGAALQHLLLAIRYHGHTATYEIYPDPMQPDLLARVKLGHRAETDAEEIQLFNSIQRRRTNRQPFLPNAVPDAVLEALQEAAAREGAWLHVVRDEASRHALADLVAEADRIQWASRQFRHELAGWLRPNDSPARDGLPGWSEGLGDFASHAGPFVVRTFDLGKGQAAKDREIALGSPALVVLGTANDTPLDWLAAGQALARVLLRARGEEVWASFLNQPLEVEELRPRVAQAIGKEESPQLILRLGYGAETHPTPRRGVREVLEDTRSLHRAPSHDADV